MFDVIKGWFVENQAFVVVGVLFVSGLVGGLVEFSKNAWKPLENKYKEDEEKLAKLKTWKRWVSQILAALLVLLFLICVKKSEIGIVGGNALFPLWYCLDFFLQYLVSCYGLKFIQKVIDNKKNQPKKEKVQYVRAYKDPVTGELIEG